MVTKQQYKEYLTQYLHSDTIANNLLNLLLDASLWNESVHPLDCPTFGYCNDNQIRIFLGKPNQELTPLQLYVLLRNPTFQFVSVSLLNDQFLLTLEII